MIIDHHKFGIHYRDNWSYPDGVVYRNVVGNMLDSSMQSVVSETVKIAAQVGVKKCKITRPLQSHCFYAVNVTLTLRD
jgi:hypothetical protein